MIREGLSKSHFTLRNLKDILGYTRPGVDEETEERTDERRMDDKNLIVCTKCPKCLYLSGVQET